MLKQMNRKSFSAQRSDSECSVGHIQRPRSINIGIGRHQDGKIYRTPQPYHIMCREDLLEPDLVEKCSQQAEVEVPSWRVVVIPRGYQMEGTENLDDEIYARRHQKPENEERRRKRWDMQRLREERMKEKLQSRQHNEHDESDGESSCLRP